MGAAANQVRELNDGALARDIEAMLLNLEMNVAGANRGVLTLLLEEAVRRLRRPRSPYEERLQEIAKLEANWDSYRGSPIQPEAIAHARRLLATVAIVPVCNGSLQLELVYQGIDLEVTIDKEGVESALFWRRPRRSRELSHGNVGASPSPAETLPPPPEEDDNA